MSKASRLVTFAILFFYISITKLGDLEAPSSFIGSPRALLMKSLEIYLLSRCLKSFGAYVTLKSLNYIYLLFSYDGLYIFLNLVKCICSI